MCVSVHSIIPCTTHTPSIHYTVYIKRKCIALNVEAGCTLYTAHNGYHRENVQLTFKYVKGTPIQNKTRKKKTKKNENKKKINRIGADTCQAHAD